MTAPTGTARRAAERIDGSYIESKRERLKHTQWVIQSAIDTEAAAIQAENERLRERCEELEANWKAEQAARLDTANVVDLYSAAKCKRQITQLTAERDALRKKTIDLEGMLATAHEAAAKAMAERDEVNQRAERAEKKLKDLQAKCIETGWFDKPKEA